VCFPVNRRYGQKLEGCFLDPTVMEHQEGHRFPSSKDFSHELADHLRTVLE